MSDIQNVAVGEGCQLQLQGMPPFWGRTDQEIFGRVLREPLDLKSEPWGDVSQPAKDLVSK